MVRRIRISEGTYKAALDAAVDVLFDFASRELEWTWDELASRAQLSYKTVYRLGTRKTRLPRWQTFWKLATACNLRLTFVDPGTGKEVVLGRKQPMLRLKVA